MRHNLRCTQLSPLRRHSSQPRALGITRRIWSTWEQRLAMAKRWARGGGRLVRAGADPVCLVPSGDSRYPLGHLGPSVSQPGGAMTGQPETVDGFIKGVVERTWEVFRK